MTRLHLGRSLARLLTRSAPAAALAWVLLATSAGARAAPAPVPSRPIAYAVVLGSNSGGPGQNDLRWAEQDARRVWEVLTQLGGYDPGRVTLIARPSRDAVVQTLAAVGARLREHARRGDRTMFFFYYSGHARASGLNFGEQLFPLPELRARLTALPATVVLAVLDACQSGAFSRVKGAEPTADFSFNSVSTLATAGVAVMSSSGGSELSQESEKLQSSFFTHHFTTGLRGVADADRDGHVTLGEVYRYAYHRTLVDTSRTSVGGQHPTLETDLRGKGEVVLSYPAQASAQLELSPALRGEILIERLPSGSVIAELHQAGNEPLRLALAPGAYRAIWRPAGTAQTGDVRECALTLAEGQRTPVDGSRCKALSDQAVALKGRWGETPPAPVWPRWNLELAGGMGADQGYSVRGASDHGFGYGYPDVLVLDVGATRALTQNLELLGSVRQLTRQEHQRRYQDNASDRYSFRVLGGGLQLRALARLFGGRINLYIQGGGGLTLGRTSYSAAQFTGDGTATGGQHVSHDWLTGGYVSFANGMMVNFGQRLGLFLQLRYTEVKGLGEDGPIEQRGHVTDLQLGLRLGLGGGR